MCVHLVKVVRLMKPRWKIEFVLRLITEYKQRAAKDISMKKRSQMPMRERDFVLENIHLLDKELARISKPCLIREIQPFSSDGPSRVSDGLARMSCVVVPPPPISPVPRGPRPRRIRGGIPHLALRVFSTTKIKV